MLKYFNMYSVILNLFQDLNIKSFLRVKNEKNFASYYVEGGGIRLYSSSAVDLLRKLS